jgi:NAD(P)-dependent dehydrogenase (short-subunit alcohol dehydrogenase family)
MTEHTPTVDLSGRRVLVPGGTGAVGEGIVRRYLSAGAEVVVPTRTQRRADEFLAVLGGAASSHLHLVVHDYTTFTGAENLAAQMTSNLGGIDDVVAPIGGWWAGTKLSEITEADWSGAFVGLATAHMAVARAALPCMTNIGAYTIVVGDSASWPVAGSGLVSMEQAAVLMMQRVLDAESEGAKRVFACVLGPVKTRLVDDGGVSADQVGAVAVAASASSATGRSIGLHSDTEVNEALALLAKW